MAPSQRLRLFTPLLAVLVFCIGIAQAEDARLKNDTFQESLQPDVKVSGTVVVGMTSGDLVAGDDLPNIHIRPSEGFAGKDVCLVVRSRDGNYLARNTYVLPDPIGGEDVSLPYRRSNKLALLKRYHARHLGIAVLEGDCADPGIRLLRPHGTEQTSGSKSLDIMVNGLNATDVYYSVESLNLSGSCETLRDGRTTVFDFWCGVLNLPALKQQDLEIEIIRERFGRELPSAKIIVAAGRNVP